MARQHDKDRNKKKNKENQEPRRSHRNRSSADKVTEDRRAPDDVQRDVEDARRVSDARRRARKRNDRRKGRDDMDVEQDDDTDEVRRLREENARLKAQRDEAIAGEAAVRQQAMAPRSEDIEPDSVDRPHNISRFTMMRARELLGIPGEEGDEEWRDLRQKIRDYMFLADLKQGGGWRAAKPRKIGKFYDAVEESYPKLRKFKGQWLTQVIAKDTYHSWAAYQRQKRNPSSARSRRAAAKRQGQDVRRTQLRQRLRIEDSDSDGDRAASRISFPDALRDDNDDDRMEGPSGLTPSDKEDGPGGDQEEDGVSAGEDSSSELSDAPDDV